MKPFGPITVGITMPVRESVPEGGYEYIVGRLEDGWREHEGKIPYVKCPKCKGFVEGFPVDRSEDTLAPLSGRRGISTCCRRCGHEFRFSGLVS